MKKIDRDEICWVMGIVDAYGAVDAKLFEFGDTNLTYSHPTYWPSTLKRWRWTPYDGFDTPIGREADTFDKQEIDAILRHIEGMGIKLKKNEEITPRGIMKKEIT